MILLCYSLSRLFLMAQNLVAKNFQGLLDFAGTRNIKLPPPVWGADVSLCQAARGFGRVGGRVLSKASRDPLWVIMGVCV